MRALVLVPVVVLLAAPLVPATAAAQSRGEGPTMRAAALVGIERGDWDGLAVRLDGEVDLQRLSPDVVVTGIGSLGYSRLSENFGTYDQTVDVFTAIPAVRLRFDVTREMGVYADVGLGLYLDTVNTDFDTGEDSDDTDMGFTARLGVGGFIWAGDNVRFQVELGLTPRFGDYSDTPFQFVVGAALPLR